MDPVKQSDPQGQLSGSQQSGSTLKPAPDSSTTQAAPQANAATDSSTLIITQDAAAPQSSSEAANDAISSSTAANEAAANIESKKFTASIHDAQAIVEAQIEAAASKLDAGPATAPGDTLVQGVSNADIGQAIDLEGGAGPTAASKGYEPVSPYTPDPYAPQKKNARNRGNKRLVLGLALICTALLICIGVGAYSVWYVKTNVLSSVSYKDYQTISVKGSAGSGSFVLEVPAEYSQDNKTEEGIEYSHRVPANKGQGNYSGIAVNTSPFTDGSQLGEIDALKTALRDKTSQASQQFVSLINGSLSGQQTVTLDSFIEKTSSSGQQFFGYDIMLKQGDSNVGKGWMLITTSNKHIYVFVVYGTDKVWQENTQAWQYMFDSLQIES